MENRSEEADEVFCLFLKNLYFFLLCHLSSYFPQSTKCYNVSQLCNPPRFYAALNCGDSGNRISEVSN